MAYVSGLVPTRFLTIMSHLVITLTILSFRHDNVLACLPMQYTKEQYTTKDAELQGGLIASVVLIGFELLSFLTGISMFWPFISLLSIIAHCSGSISLCYFVMDRWDCDLYWITFTLCSIIPAILELFVLFGVFVLKKR